MKKLLVALLLIASSANAEEGLYLKTAMGLNHINKSYHKDSLYSGELNFQLLD